MKTVLVQTTQRTFHDVLASLLDRKVQMATTHESHEGTEDWHYIIYRVETGDTVEPILKAAYHRDGNSRFYIDPLQLIEV